MPMPPDHGVWLDNDEGGAPAGPQPRQPDPEDAIPAPKLGPRNGALEDGELLAKGEILREEGSSPGHEVPDQAPWDSPSPHGALLPEGRGGVFY